MPVDGIWPVLAVPVIAVGALAAGAMNPAGALVGGLIGLAVAVGAGWTGFLMLASLLVIGSACSGRGRRGRDSVQALCNGAVAAAAALAAGFGERWGVAAMAGALATALSDTVSAELGGRGGRARLLLFGQSVPAGTDGAMTWTGTAAGMLAACVVPLIGWLGGYWEGSLRTAGLVALAGFVGNLLDSLIGLFVQPHMGRRKNDWTNLLATACGALLAARLT